MKANSFENISLKSSIWALLEQLNEFSDFINPEKQHIYTTSLNKIQHKLRNSYVKLHPNEYTDVPLYDAIYDDWGLGED